ncbi:transglycosylase SLT domain-containing protein [Streptomyces sp. NBC_00690]|uniref:transglycosylase SLT domain-containing protein n=1 Tax=Streptomyces sp. NBC_00690 TaxID=2975808 RepID=UPI002E294AAA|nr:transglycosylase SLT domain-containing protein [Streptomyces sp. NBC_00690]
MPAFGKHRRPQNSSIAKSLMVLGASGALLAIPALGTATAHAAQPTSTKAAPAVIAQQQVSKQDTAKTYSVVTGDSLSQIAADHQLSGGWESLYEQNREAVGDDPSLIHPGLKLSLGKAGTKAPESTAKTATIAAEPVAYSAPAAAVTYANNLDGWIKESLAVMAEHGIPGTYDGIHRNIIRESSGNPLAINNWDSNAIAGTPSKGLLQVIDPTFRAYHVPGTSTNSYDPVANITAACNYAADRYGSIDNVFGAY